MKNTAILTQNTEKQMQTALKFSQ